MLGTIFNVAAILLGGILGLSLGRQISNKLQLRIKYFLGAVTIYLGFTLAWRSINGSFGLVLKQIGILFLALILGNVVGKILHLQKMLNRLGQWAKAQLTNAESQDSPKLSEGFVTCSLLFCVGPMAILGSVEDGLTGNFRILATKSAMDGLATMAFVKPFGWGPMLAALPVLVYQGSITLAARGIQPYLEQKALLDSINATGGLLLLCVAVVILDIARVELADYLPSLMVAPLLTWWWLV